MEPPKKFAFGFSKVVKKPALLTPLVVETVEYIKCVEDNSVKLVNEELQKPKPLPVIPMPKGSSVKDRILDAIKAREEAKSKDESKAENPRVPAGSSTTLNGESKPMTLDELAAKELLEGATSSDEKKEDLVIPKSETAEANREAATLDDYEQMPIADYGQAMLRGMGWDPKKGIGLNEKVVVPNIPQVRPKGMGLGADRSMASQTAKSNSDEAAVLKRGSMVKVIAGPHSQLYGKVEAFEELPGRILVRLALGNEVVSMGEFMVQLVPLSEYSKNAKVMNLDKYKAALESGNGIKREGDVKRERDVKNEPYDSRRADRSNFSERRPNRDVKYSNSKVPSRRNVSRDSSCSRDFSSSSDDYAESRSRGQSTERSSKRDKYKKRDYSDSDSNSRKKKREKKKSRKRPSSEKSSEEEKRRKRKRDKEQSQVTRRKDGDNGPSAGEYKHKKCKKSRK